MKRKGTLVLSDGKRFEGEVIGAERAVTGEVVFCTSSSGYIEALSDPTYAGQIVVAVYPILGNYGFPAKEEGESGWESDTIQPLGIVMHDYTEHYNHWKAVESLHTTLLNHGKVGLVGVDTRELTKYLREHGTLTGTIEVEGCVQEEPLCQQLPLNTESAATTYGNPEHKKVLLLDCGVKKASSHSC